MLEFIATNYIIFIIIAIVLLLGLFGYIMDRRKYDEYKDEIINSANFVQTNINSNPGVEVQSVDMNPSNQSTGVNPPQN